MAEWIGAAGGGDKYKKPAGWLDLHPEDVKFLVNEAMGGAWAFAAGGASLMSRIAQGVAPTDIDIRDYPVLRQYFGHNYGTSVDREFKEAREKALDAKAGVAEAVKREGWGSDAVEFRLLRP